MATETYAGLIGQDFFPTALVPTGVTQNGVTAPFTLVGEGIRLNTPLAAAVPVVITGDALGSTAGGAFAGLTDTQLRAAAVATIPAMASGGHLSVTTATTGTNFTAFAAQACKQLTILNDTGTKLEVRQDGAGVAIRVPDGAVMTFFGLTNANQLGVRRVDVSNTQVTATARWEA